MTSNYNINALKTLTHEAGHTVGLSHNSDDGANAGGRDSMVSGIVSTLLIYDTLNLHHIAHINSEY